MRKLFIIILISSALINGNLFAYDPPLGYKWGMTQDQAKSMTKEEVENIDPYCFIFYKDIASYNMEAILSFTEDDKLALVYLLVTNENKKKFETFEALEGILKEKYGEPSKESKEIIPKSLVEYYDRSEIVTFGGIVKLNWFGEDSMIILLIKGFKDLKPPRIMIQYIHSDLSEKFIKEWRLRKGKGL